MSSMGEKIREARKNMGLTQQQFADKLGLDSEVGYKAVSKWETEVNKPSVKTLKDISDLTQKPIAYYAGKEELEDTNQEVEKSSIDEFLDRLLKEGIIEDINNINDDVADMILNAVKTDLQLRKLKKKEQ